MSIIQPIVTFLQLGRLALVFTAISNAWLIVLLSKLSRNDLIHTTHAIQVYTTTELLILTAILAASMYLFGMITNDLFDAKRDQSFAPNRPIPSGKISLTSTIIIAAAFLIIAIAASIPLGQYSVIAAILCIMMILFYNAAGKHLPAVGVITLGLIRATHMLIINPKLAFCWPIWLTLSFILIISTICHRLESKRPLMDGPQILTVLAGWVFLSMMLIIWMTYRKTLEISGLTFIWIGPLLATFAYTIVATYTWKSAKSKAQAGGLLMKRGLLFLIIFDASWLLSAEQYKHSLLIAALIPAAYLTMWITSILKKISTPAPYENTNT